MKTPEEGVETLNHSLLMATGVLGLILVVVALLGDLQWGWNGLWPSVFLEMGVATMLVAVFFLLERRFVGVIRTILTVSGHATTSEAQHLVRSTNDFSTYLSGLLDDDFSTPGLASAYVSKEPDHEYDAWYDHKLNQVVVGSGLVQDQHVIRHLWGHHFLEHLRKATTPVLKTYVAEHVWGHGYPDHRDQASPRRDQYSEVIEAGLADYLACSFDSNPMVLTVEAPLGPLKKQRSLASTTTMTSIDELASSHEKGQVIAEALWELRGLAGKKQCDKAALSAWWRSSSKTDLIEYAERVVDDLVQIQGRPDHGDRFWSAFAKRGIEPRA